MSEMRQRRGQPSEEEISAKDEEIAKLKAQLEATKSQQVATQEEPKSEEQQQKDLAERLYNALKEKKESQVKGLSHRAKDYKEKLKADPYNMEYIFHLGVAYAADGLWEQSQNVLLRGYKRVKEFEDAGVRFEFLTVLAEASLKANKFRQALAVLNDMEEPTTDEHKAHYEILRCNIYCENGDMERGLKSLNKAFEGQDFEQALKMWTSCLGALKKAGAVDLSKAKLLDMAPDEESKGKVTAMEALHTVVGKFEADGGPQPLTKMMKQGMVLMAGIFGVALLYVLYLLESQSLSRLKLNS